MDEIEIPLPFPEPLEAVRAPVWLAGLACVLFAWLVLAAIVLLVVFSRNSVSTERDENL